jgi:uncharacterized protein YecE (DUF72 family)
MTNFLIGTGGWAYFAVGPDPLALYSQKFNFVEVNSTFYSLPSRRRVISWRQRVPEDFTFAIRCPQAVTHRHHFNLTDDALIYFQQICSIYHLLAARYLVFITPSQFPFTHKTIDNIKSCFQRLKEQDIQAVWEIRTPLSRLPRSIPDIFRDYDVVHCVDLSQYLPLCSSPVIYTRLFGQGQHNVYQFTNQELTELDHTITKQHVDEAVISFHNVKMYKDAARYSIYRATHRFPPVTTAVIQNSIRHVLLEDVQFPITTQDLIADQGWKVIDRSNHTTCHARDLLSLLPNKHFHTLEEVLSALKQIAS